MSECEANHSFQALQLSTLYTFFAYHVNVFLYYTVRCGTSKPYGLTRRKVIIITTFLYPPQYIMILFFQTARNIQMLYLPSTGVSNNTFQRKMRYCGYKFIWMTIFLQADTSNVFSLDTLYYGHASESYSTEYFEFNVLPSLTSAFGTTSDIVIVFMTLNRFELVQVRTETQKI